MKEVRWTLPADHFNHRDLLSPTVKFMRYPPLSLPEDVYCGSELVKSLLGIDKSIGYNLRDKECLEKWLVNFKKRKDPMNDMEKELDRLWRATGNESVDVKEELEDLHKVYMEAEEHLKHREANALEQATFAMKKFLEVQEERKKISNKLSNLKTKMCGLSDCEHEDEDD